MHNKLFPRITKYQRRFIILQHSILNGILLSRECYDAVVYPFGNKPDITAQPQGFRVCKIIQMFITLRLDRVEFILYLFTPGSRTRRET